MSILSVCPRLLKVGFVTALGIGVAYVRLTAMIGGGFSRKIRGMRY